MTESYFESKEFFNYCNKVFNHVFKQFYKKYVRYREDMFSEGLLKAIEQKDMIIKISNENDLFKKLCKCFEYGCAKTVRKNQSNSNFSDFFEDYSGADFSFDFFKTSSDEYEKSFNFDFLKNELLNFLNNKEEDERNAIILFLQKNSIKDVSNVLHTNLRIASAFIKNFKETFARKLIDCGYFNDLSILSISKQDKKNLRSTLSYNRKKGIVDFKNYKCEYKIYDLIRNSQSYKPFADCLKISEEELKSIVEHRMNKRKLFLFEVAKLRKNFFPTYSFETLIFS